MTSSQKRRLRKQKLRESIRATSGMSQQTAKVYSEIDLRELTQARYSLKSDGPLLTSDGMHNRMLHEIANPLPDFIGVTEHGKSDCEMADGTCRQDGRFTERKDRDNQTFPGFKFPTRFSELPPFKIG